MVSGFTVLRQATKRFARDVPVYLQNSLATSSSGSESSLQENLKFLKAKLIFVSLKKSCRNKYNFCQYKTNRWKLYYFSSAGGGNENYITFHRPTLSLSPPSRPCCPRTLPLSDLNAMRRSPIDDRASPARHPRLLRPSPGQPRRAPARHRPWWASPACARGRDTPHLPTVLSSTRPSSPLPRPRRRSSMTCSTFGRPDRPWHAHSYPIGAPANSSTFALVQALHAAAGATSTTLPLP
jgi:hypothetical protein